jgi:hypothetical protein
MGNIINLLHLLHNYGHKFFNANGYLFRLLNEKRTKFKCHSTQVFGTFKIIQTLGTWIAKPLPHDQMGPFQNNLGWTLFLKSFDLPWQIVIQPTLEEEATLGKNKKHCPTPTLIHILIYFQLVDVIMMWVEKNDIYFNNVLNFHSCHPLWIGCVKGKIVITIPT